MQLNRGTGRNNIRDRAFYLVYELAPRRGTLPPNDLLAGVCHPSGIRERRQETDSSTNSRLVIGSPVPARLQLCLTNGPQSRYFIVTEDIAVRSGVPLGLVSILQQCSVHQWQ